MPYLQAGQQVKSNIWAEINDLENEFMLHCQIGE
jgi:hypothetical protein